MGKIFLLVHVQTIWQTHGSILKKYRQGTINKIKTDYGPTLFRNQYIFLNGRLLKTE